MFVHEDDRRKLVEVIENEPMKTLKILYAKENCVVGDHYHQFKTENFYLLSGSGMLEFEILDTGLSGLNVLEVGKLYKIEPRVYHKFSLTPGSILIGTASAKYDPDDELPR